MKEPGRLFLEVMYAIGFEGSPLEPSEAMDGLYGGVDTT
jgi:hypothetical protein